MDKFPKFFFILITFLASLNLFAQGNSTVDDQENPFAPRFTLGTGFYTLTGDIQNSDLGFLNGQLGYNAGMKFILDENRELSFSLYRASFYGNNNNERFSSDIDGFGLHYNYVLNDLFGELRISPLTTLGIQSQSISTTFEGIKKDRVNSLAIPLGFGLRMDISDRMQFDITFNFALGMSDIDMSEISVDKSDGYKSLNFTIHYDLFSYVTNKVDESSDDSYYNDVDFAKIESEDEDGDLVVDMYDYCPRTPLGVKVDNNGCPFDDDKDGIPNYLDKQKDTPIGLLIDENGVALSIDKYKSVYSDSEVASRKYANFYNEIEIKREDYKTIDEYLIAKANAFNKAFNESKSDKLIIKPLIYKVQIASFNEVIPARILNKLLSIDDLESFVMDDNSVVYAVGNYERVNDAQIRQDEMDPKWYDETEILVDNNGAISKYIYPSEEITDFDYDKKVSSTDSGSVNSEPFDSTTFRVQIGAFRKPLSNQIFKGIDNLISFTNKNGLIIYMVGSFNKYEEAIDYQSQMQARGFDDAFIITYDNGERIKLNIAISKNKSKKKKEVNKSKIDSKNEVLNISFTVQVLVAKATVDTNLLSKFSQLGNVEKIAKGSDMYEYYAGTYSNYSDAQIQLSKAKKIGFSDAFIFSVENGERKSIEQK
ncbi:hypothetical protein N8692_02865 [Flavobacteriales bacterium]|nr:hypothetical protein [Flavobacteriales bacterium]